MWQGHRAPILMDGDGGPLEWAPSPEPRFASSQAPLLTSPGDLAPARPHAKALVWRWAGARPKVSLFSQQAAPSRDRARGSPAAGCLLVPPRCCGDDLGAGGEPYLQGDSVCSAPSHTAPGSLPGSHLGPRPLAPIPRPPARMFHDPVGKHVSQHVRPRAPGRRLPPPACRPPCLAGVAPPMSPPWPSWGPVLGLPGPGFLVAEASQVPLLSMWSPKPTGLSPLAVPRPKSAARTHAWTPVCGGGSGREEAGRRPGGVGRRAEPRPGGRKAFE